MKMHAYLQSFFFFNQRHTQNFSTFPTVGLRSQDFQDSRGQEHISRLSVMLQPLIRNFVLARFVLFGSAAREDYCLKQ